MQSYRYLKCERRIGTGKEKCGLPPANHGCGAQGRNVMVVAHPFIAPFGMRRQSQESNAPSEVEEW